MVRILYGVIIKLCFSTALNNNSSKGVWMLPEVTSRSRDVNTHDGGVIHLINMQMTYLMCKLPSYMQSGPLNMKIN
jgi:hypothetical protein